MKFSTLLPLLFFCLAFQNLTGQDGVKIWQKNYNTDGVGSFDDVIVDSKGYVIALGEWEPTTNKSLLVYKFNSSGNTVWQKSYSDSGYDLEAYYIKEGPDNNYFIAGEWNDTRTGFIAKIDANGNMTSYKKMGFELTDFEIEKDGTILFVGSKNDKAYICKYSATLNLLWEKNLTISFTQGFQTGAIMSMDKSLDGGYYLLTTGNGIKAERSASDAVVIKVNNQGNLAWSKAYGGTNSEEIYDSGGNAFRAEIIGTQDGGFAFAIYSRSNNLDIKELNSQNDGWVLKSNSLGLIQWAKKIGGENIPGNIPNGIREKSNGNITVFGRAGNGGKLGCVQDKSTIAWFAEMDKVDGKIVFRKCFGGEQNFDVIRSVFISTNTTYSVGIYNDDAWIFAFRFGNAISTATDNTILLENISIYPNPANEFIQFTGSDQIFNDLRIDILNAQGRLMSRKIIQKGSITQEKIATNMLPNGTYFLAITAQEAWITLPFVIAQ